MSFFIKFYSKELRFTQKLFKVAQYLQHTKQPNLNSQIKVDRNSKIKI